MPAPTNRTIAAMTLGALTTAILVALRLTQPLPEPTQTIASDLYQPTSEIPGTRPPAGSPPAITNAPGVSAFPVTSTALPGQAAISEADVRVWFTTHSPPFWNGNDPRPELIEVRFLPVEAVAQLLGRSLSRPPGTLICIAAFVGASASFTPRLPPGAQVVATADPDRPIHVVQIFDAETGNLLGQGFERAWPPRN